MSAESGEATRGGRSLRSLLSRLAQRAKHWVIKLVQTIALTYRDGFGTLEKFFSILGVLTSIAFAIIGPRAPTLALFALGVAFFAFLVPVVVAVVRHQSRARHAPHPLSKVQSFTAISYELTSKADLSELFEFSEDEFGETFPDEVDTNAVRQGSAFGLRLTNETGKNIGFLDVYHFRKDILELWRYGNLNEKEMTIDHFVPLRSIKKPRSHNLELAIGALYIDTSNPIVDHFLAHTFVEAAMDYLNNVCRKFSSVSLYATIFSRSGREWAKNQGFELDIRAEMRGDGHDLYVKNFTPRKSLLRETYSSYGRRFEYRIRVRV